MRLPSSAQKRAVKRRARSATSLCAGPQRGNRDRKDVQAVEQILAKPAALDQIDEILVGRRDQPEIDLDRPSRADRVDLPVLQGAQQLHLGLEGQFADFVEEQRAAVGFGELADVSFRGAGEGALLVAEQDGFDEVFRQRPAIDGDESLTSPLGAALDGARHQFLADPRFSFDQHGNIRLRRAFGEPNDARHVLGLGDDVLERQLAGAAARGPAQFVFERVDAQRVLDRDLQPLGADGLDDKVQRAGAHRGNHRFDRAMRGLDDRGNPDRPPAHALKHAHAVEVGHDQIENDEIDRRALRQFQPRQRLFPGRRRLDVIAESPAHGLQQPALNGIVVNDEDQGGHVRSMPCGPFDRLPTHRRPSQ